MVDMIDFHMIYFFLDDNEKLFVMLSAIWYHFYNLKNMKNAHGGVSLLVVVQKFATL